MSGLIEVPFQSQSLYAENPDLALTESDYRLLVESFTSQMAVLLSYMNQYPTHVFVPLSSPEFGYHVAVQGRFGLDELMPFFRKAPNALTVVDSRPCGFFRIRLIRVEPGKPIERIAEVEISLLKEAAGTGFELFWAPDPDEEPRIIRFYPRQEVDKVAGLVAEWGMRFSLLRRYPDLARVCALP